MSSGNHTITAPNEEDVATAIRRYIAEAILLREIKRKHSYGDDGLTYLLNDAAYLTMTW